MPADETNLPSDLAHAVHVTSQLAGGGAAGLLGGILKELQRSDREFSWHLVPKLAAAFIGGMGAKAMAQAGGVADENAVLAICFTVGLVGTAILTDAGRMLLKRYLPVDVPSPHQLAPEGRQSVLPGNGGTPDT